MGVSASICVSYFLGGVLFSFCWFVLFYYGMSVLFYLIFISVLVLDDFLFFKERERKFVHFDRREGGKYLGRIEGGNMVIRIHYIKKSILFMKG